MSLQEDHTEEPLPADGGEAATAEEELDPLAQAERERDEHLDTARRIAAEFDNYKKLSLIHI